MSLPRPNPPPHPQPALRSFRWRVMGNEKGQDSNVNIDIIRNTYQILWFILLFQYIPFIWDFFLGI